MPLGQDYLSVTLPVGTKGRRHQAIPGGVRPNHLAKREREPAYTCKVFFDLGPYMSSAHKREWKFCSPMRGEKRINFVAFSPDGSLIAFGDGNPFARDKTGAIRLYDAGMGRR